MEEKDGTGATTRLATPQLSNCHPWRGGEWRRRTAASQRGGANDADNGQRKGPRVAGWWCSSLPSICFSEPVCGVGEAGWCLLVFSILERAVTGKPPGPGCRVGNEGWGRNGVKGGIAPPRLKSSGAGLPLENTRRIIKIVPALQLRGIALTATPTDLDAAANQCIATRLSLNPSSSKRCRGLGTTAAELLLGGRAPHSRQTRQITAAAS